MKWLKTTVATGDGTHEAIAPEVISASRSTDIPAFHSEWFVGRLRAGYVRWVNPFNQQPQYVSFQRTKAVVFWSKNPAPMLRFLPELDQRKIAYYFQFTLNDYEAEGLEPHVPPIEQRIDTFIHISTLLGRERVVWRFDPLILTDRLSPDQLLHKIQTIGERIHSYTAKLVFSFADISNYAKVQRNLKRAGISYVDFTAEQMREMGRRIGDLCQRWGIEPVTCGEREDLSMYGVNKNKCIDSDLLLAITGFDPAICDLFGHRAGGQLGIFAEEKTPSGAAKDPGQRVECGCALSKDIGQYNTCPHLCLYCYANTSPALVERNVSRFNGREAILGD